MIINSAIARGLVSKTMKSIAILTVDVRVTHYARMIYVIEQEFSNRGYNVTVCNTGGSIEECEKYMEILSEKQVDGIVLIGSVFNELINYPDITSKIKDIPVVMANGKVNLPNFYSVLVDDTKGIRTAVDYLYEKGHRELVYVYDMETDSGWAKRQGFLEAMKLHDLLEAEKKGDTQQIRPGRRPESSGDTVFLWHQFYRCGVRGRQYCHWHDEGLKKAGLFHSGSGGDHRIQ
uniref:substrate-binding domain-containing protein n=1 Tax=Clostridium sp. NkU-1 TaxID=1095009 RepID=UPI000A4620FF